MSYRDQELAPRYCVRLGSGRESRICLTLLVTFRAERRSCNWLYNLEQAGETSRDELPQLGSQQRLPTEFA